MGMMIKKGKGIYMKVALSVVSAVTMVAIFATPASANYEIIRWSSGMCQVIDQSLKPFSNDFKKGRKRFTSYEQANLFKAQLILKGQCW
jgi:hypothetical protein